MTQPSQSLAQIRGPGLRVALGLFGVPAAVALSVSMTYYGYDNRKVPELHLYRSICAIFVYNEGSTSRLNLMNATVDVGSGEGKNITENILPMFLSGCYSLRLFLRTLEGFFDEVGGVNR